MGGWQKPETCCRTPLFPVPWLWISHLVRCEWWSVSKDQQWFRVFSVNPGAKLQSCSQERVRDRVHRDGDGSWGEGKQGVPQESGAPEGAIPSSSPGDTFVGPKNNSDLNF